MAKMVHFKFNWHGPACLAWHSSALAFNGYLIILEEIPVGQYSQKTIKTKTTSAKKMSYVMYSDFLFSKVSLQL